MVHNYSIAVPYSLKKLVRLGCTTEGLFTEDLIETINYIKPYRVLAVVTVLQ